VQLVLINAQDEEDTGKLPDPARRNITFNDTPDVFENYDEDYELDDGEGYDENGEEVQEQDETNADQKAGVTRQGSNASITSDPSRPSRVQSMSIGQNFLKVRLIIQTLLTKTLTDAHQFFTIIQKLLGRNSVSKDKERDKVSPTGGSPSPAPSAFISNRTSSIGFKPKQSMSDQVSPISKSELGSLSRIGDLSQDKVCIRSI
jgi:hypothetical protein